MVTNGQRQDIPDEILETASDWLFRLQAEPKNARLRSGLAGWVAADARHSRAWEAARQAWAATGMVPPAFVAPVAAAQRRPCRPLARIAMAVAAGIAALALLPGLALNLQADYRTATAQNRAIDLADGSTLTLAADSAVNTDFSDPVRAVRLLRGEAHFQVKRDRDRPFVITGGDLTVTVTGTAFDVAFTDRQASVDVSEGTVTVAYHGTENRLSAGQRLEVDRVTGALNRRDVDPADVAAWRRGRLAVRDATLGNVVDDLRRHHFGVIVFADETLAGRRVTGVFDLDAPERALKALVEPYGGKVRRVTPFILMVSAA